MKLFEPLNVGGMIIPNRVMVPAMVTRLSGEDGLVNKDISDRYVRFSNRPVGVKHFQTIHHCSVDVAHGLVLLFGIGTKAVPSWDSRTRRNNLCGGFAI
jgi:2,4-dienoyl-CoA reductase-like NADH-dependent reductase (Old Yellow Enzyme family)